MAKLDPLSIRVFEILVSLIFIIFFIPLFFFVALIIFITTQANPFFLQKRVGLSRKSFYLIKFRSLKSSIDPYLSTHLLSKDSVTHVGKFIRKYKIDELPQLFNVLIGHLSFVGYRPCLPSQSEVIRERDKFCLFSFKPGITGFAQINNIDMSTPIILAYYDKYLFDNLTLWFYFKCIFQTLFGKGFGDPRA